MNPHLSIAHEQIATLKPYQAGQSMQSLKNIAKDSIIKLASNENPLGASPKAKQAIINELDECYLYPEYMNRTLENLGQHLNVETGQLILGNGSENIISMLIQTFNRPENHFLIPQYGFSAYKINAKAHNANIKIIPTPNYRLDAEQVISLTNNNTALLFIDNPNNPIGHYLKHQEIEHILQNIPQTTLLVLDEAYYEYAKDTQDYPNSLALQAKYPNLVILRTFSKIYGLAGLRVGYGIANEQLIELLNRVRFPFNVASLSLAAASAALRDQEFVKKSIIINKSGLLAYQACFEQLNLDIFPSLGNFVTVNLKQDSSNFINYMLEQGIILRGLKPYQLPNHIRVSIGTEMQNTRTIEQFNQYFGD